MSVHPTAIVAPGAQLAPDVVVGAFTIVHDDVRIDAGGVVESHCVLGLPTPAAEGRPLVVGPDAHIRSHSVLYAGSSFGAGLRTGHHVTVREGNVAGDGLQIGSYGDFQGDTTFGEHVRSQSNVFIPKHTTIGSYVWLFPGATLTNDRLPPSEEPHHRGPAIEDFCVIGAGATVLPGVRVGAHVVVAAGSLVTADVAPGDLVAGVPARRRGRAADLRLPDGGGPAYPWTQRFARGYPPEVVGRWRAEL
jgi:acyl-[acyl carrier protein]--UDP-N-acetylglucosamine O-acyltransferase